MNGTDDDLGEQAKRLRAERRPFVTARVVRADKPASARAGDSALVLDDGKIIGFVGGECAHTSVQVQALATLETGEPVLLRITPEAIAPGSEPQEAESGAVTVHNPCLSGGALEIFLEPSLPPLLVVVHGDAPIARAVRELAGWLGFDAHLWVHDDAPPPDTAAVVVASHGGAEQAVIEAAVRAGVAYVGLVASPRRGEAVLVGLGLDTADRKRVHTPAGIDIGSRTPEEVALSVLAEIVSVRPRPQRPPRSAPVPTPDGPVATDPVCGMSVATVDSSRHLDHDGVRYWFCGSGCEEAFRADMGAFVDRDR
jgi:xanthine dehydrogenase accessory factor